MKRRKQATERKVCFSFIWQTAPQSMMQEVGSLRVQDRCRGL